MKKVRNNIIIIVIVLGFFFLTPTLVKEVPMLEPFIRQNILKIFIVSIIITLICFINIMLAGPKTHDSRKISIGDIPQEFDEIFEKLKNQDLTGMPKVIKKNTFMLILRYIIIFMILYFVGRTQFGEESLFVACIMSFFIFIFGIFINQESEDIIEYTKFYKEKFIKKLIDLSFLNLKYENTIDEKKLKEMESIYIDCKYDNSREIVAEDFIEGFFKENTYLKMADINTSDSQGPIFSGIFAYSKINKTFDERILISANKEDTSGNYTKITMDSTVFEKYFDIYCKDKMSTYKILTSDTMIDLYNLHKECKIQFEIAIYKNFVGIKFYTTGEFEPYNYDCKIEKEIFYRHYSIVNFVGSILHTINKAIDEYEV